MGVCVCVCVFPFFSVFLFEVGEEVEIYANVCILFSDFWSSLSNPR